MNPYQILGISPSASDDEIKKAYRTLSKKYHPDANIGNPHQAEYTEKFKEVQNAYKTIMDERKKGFKQQSYGSQPAAISIMEMTKKLIKKLVVLFKVDVIKKL